VAKSEDKKIDTSYDYHKIAKERLIWVVKPIFIVSIITWTLHPGTTNIANVNNNAKLGFLLGAIFGLFIFRKELTHYLITRRKETTERKNRVPDEYYFGKIKKVLQETPK